MNHDSENSKRRSPCRTGGKSSGGNDFGENGYLCVCGYQYVLPTGIHLNGMPFRPTLSASIPKALDELSREEFDAAMKIGLGQAKANQSTTVDDAFDRLIEELVDG